MWFSAVRAMGGFSNNPTKAQFVSAYKKLLLHTQIKASEKGNCLPLSKITILNGNIRPIDLLNTTHQIPELPKQTEIMETALLPDLDLTSE